MSAKEMAARAPRSMNMMASATRMRSAEGSRLLSVFSVMVFTSAWAADEFWLRKLIEAFRTRSWAYVGVGECGCVGVWVCGYVYV